MVRADAFSRSLIVKEASDYGLDPNFVEAVFLQEGGNPYQVNWDNNHFAHGPMQVSLSAALDGGYSPTDLVFDPTHKESYSPALASPSLSIKFGTAYLATRGIVVGCLNGDYKCLLAAYNAGNIIGRDLNTGNYRNQSYVDEVWARYTEISGGEVREAPAAPNPSAFPPLESFPCTMLAKSVKDSSNVSSDKAPAAYIPRSPYSPYISIIYTPKKGTASFDLASGDPDGRPRWLTYFELHERLGGLSTARARLFDTGADIIVNAVSENNSDSLDSVGNPQYDSESATRLSVSDFDPLDNVKIIFGYASSSAEIAEDNSIFGTVFPGSMGMQSLKIDPLSKFVAPRREMFLQNYQPRFLGYGVEIDLVFADASAIAALESKTKTYVKDDGTGLVIASGQQGGVPDSQSSTDLGIVEEICAEHGWQVCSEKTAKLLSYEGHATNELRDRPIVQSGKDDITFLREKLAPSAMSATSNAAAYSVYLDSSGTSPEPPTLHFHPPNLSAPASRSYYYTRSRLGTVLRFEPVVNGQLIALFGGVTAVLAGTDMVTKKPISSKSQSTDPDNNSLPGNPLPTETTYQEDGPDGVVSKTVSPTTLNNSPDKNKEEQQGAAQSFRQSGSLASLTAQMVVLGDPKVRAGMTVDISIEVFNPAGSGDSLGWDYLVDSTQGILGSIFLNRPTPPRELYVKRGLHYTSGKWLVSEVRHVIQGGEYLTYLELLRNTLQTPSFSGFGKSEADDLTNLNVSSNLNTR
jgi:hypothetical protein